MISLLSTLAFAERPAPFPDPLPAVAWSPPAVARRALSSGLPVIVVPDHEVPLFEVRLLIRVGEHADPVGLEGLCAVTFDVLDEGAGPRDAAAFAAAVEALGATISTGCGGDSASVQVSGIVRNLPAALDLFADVIRSPHLGESDVSIARERHVNALAVQLERPDTLADRAQVKLQYGERYLGRSPSVVSLRTITAGQVQGLWSKRVGPSVAAIVAGGDVDPDALVALLEARLGDWRPAIEPVQVDAAPRDPDAKLYVLDLPGAPQSAVRAWATVAHGADPARLPLEIGTEVLGGSFGSRLNQNLREGKGWTYGARCGTAYRAGPGWLTCSTLVRADATADAVRELRRELADLRVERPLTPAEVEAARQSLLRAWPLRRETNGAVLGELGQIWLRELPLDWTDRWRAGIGAAPAAEVATTLGAAADPARTSFLVVGDLAKVRTELEAVGLPIVEVGVE